MKFNQWTLGLAALGVVSLASAVRADEKPSPVMTALSSTTLSGYVDTSAQWNLGTGNANNPAYGFGGAGKADGFNLNAVKVSLAKDPDAADNWGAGYKVDLLLGPDANTYATQSSFTAGDFAIRQAYVDLKAPVGNGLDIKVGVFDTITGYEVGDAPNNPNFTRSYQWTIEPTTHTGVLLSYTVNEMISASAGIADTFGPHINSRAFPVKAESYKTYMADVSFTAPTNWGWAGGSSMNAVVINGFNAGSPTKGGTPADQTSFYIGSTLNTPLKELKVGASYDYEGSGSQTILGAPVTAGYANATDLYATYQLSEKLTFYGRGEWFTQSKANAVIGLPSKVFALTGTVQYDLWKNVLSRLEIRWDHSADGSLAYGGTVPGTPNKKNAYEIIANVAYKF
jgi:hypothetical protein